MVIVRADIKNLEFANSEDLLKSKELKNLIMWSVPRSIEYAMNNNKQSAPIFEIGTSDYYLEIDRTNWISALESVMEFKAEEDTNDSYIECAKIRDLINRISEKV